METQLMALLASPAAIVIALMGATIAGMAFALRKLVERERERIQIDKDAEDLKVAVRRLKLAAGNMALQTADDRREALTRVILQQRMSLGEQNGLVKDLYASQQYVTEAIRSLNSVYDDVAVITGDGDSYVRLTCIQPSVKTANATTNATAGRQTASLTKDAIRNIGKFLIAQRDSGSPGWKKALKKHSSLQDYYPVARQFAIENGLAGSGKLGGLPEDKKRELLEKLEVV